MNLYNSIIDLKEQEEEKKINFFITKSNLRKLLKHSKKLKLTKSKFIEYFLSNINRRSLNEINKRKVDTDKCIKIKRTIKISTLLKLKNIIKIENLTNKNTVMKMTRTTLINRLIEKHL